MASKERKRKEYTKIGESEGQWKISFTKLPRRVCKEQVIFNIDFYGSRTMPSPKENPPQP